MFKTSPLKIDQAKEEERKQRSLYFKNLRKQQRKRRKERRKEEKSVKTEQKRKSRFQKLVATIEDKASQDPGKALHLPDDVMMNMSLETEKPTSNRRSQKSTIEAVEKRHVAGQLSEIRQTSLVKLGTSIGSGTYGSCTLTKYRDMIVAIKEIKSCGDGRNETEKQRKAVLHEATIIASLGDHPGLPLLFGVQAKVAPFGIVFQFHGDNKRSLTLWRAAKKVKLSNDEWMTIVGLIGDALQHIHTQGFIQNDLKANNVVLEKKGGHFNPVIVVFGKSIKIQAAERYKRTLSSKQEREKYLQSITCGTRTH